MTAKTLADGLNASNGADDEYLPSTDEVRLRIVLQTSAAHWRARFAQDERDDARPPSADTPGKGGTHTEGDEVFVALRGCIVGWNGCSSPAAGANFE